MWWRGPSTKLKTKALLSRDLVTLDKSNLFESVSSFAKWGSYCSLGVNIHLQRSNSEVNIDYFVKLSFLCCDVQSQQAYAPDSVCPGPVLRAGHQPPKSGPEKNQWASLVAKCGCPQQLESDCIQRTRSSLSCQGSWANFSGAEWSINKKGAKVRGSGTRARLGRMPNAGRWGWPFGRKAVPQTPCLEELPTARQSRAQPTEHGQAARGLSRAWDRPLWPTAGPAPALFSS
jgi:hypothetical protein